MSSNLDTFEKWEKQGLLKEKLKLIEGLVAENVTHEKIALRLGISQKTLNKMKNKHIEFARAFSKGETILKDSLISAIYKKAMGFHQEESQTLIEDVGGKQKRKLVKTNKYYPPDLSSAKYLLIVKFGRSFNDKKDELYLMEKRINNKEDVWEYEK
ncbi:MAG: hypothetical protein PHD47_01885 [Acholeplasmataceae bacterium]|nr:hypothetical protein [Acholeplasmataceae bacterium]